jgi:hypothetical protein
MALVMPNQGEVDMLQKQLNKIALENLNLDLFSNNITPAETDVASSYTVPTFTGYATKTLTGSAWTVTAGAPSSAAGAAQTFTCTAGGTTQQIYGYRFTGTTTGNIWIAERFPDAPTPISNTNDSITISPNFTLD